MTSMQTATLFQQPTIPTAKQNKKVLDALLDAQGEWVNGRYFLHTLYLSQFHTRIHELERDHHWNIEHSEFVDEHGFKSYRIVL